MRKKPQRIVSLLLSLLLFLCALPTARAYEMGDPWQADLTAARKASPMTYSWVLTAALAREPVWQLSKS